MIIAAGHNFDMFTWGYKGADGHGRKCLNCDTYDTVLSHGPGPEATATRFQTCTICGYIIVPAFGIPAAGAKDDEPETEDRSCACRNLYGAGILPQYR